MRNRTNDHQGSKTCVQCDNKTLTQWSFFIQKLLLVFEKILQIFSFNFIRTKTIVKHKMLFQHPFSSFVKDICEENQLARENEIFCINYLQNFYIRTE